MKTLLLKPFGVEIHADQLGRPLNDLSITTLEKSISDHRVAILRDFVPLNDDELLSFCRKLGAIMEWEFGAVNELKTREDTPNYLYTNREVPFHWDGAFAGKIPRYIFFSCEEAPDPNAGGATTFCDTTLLLRKIPPQTRKLWENISITYETDKILHYGGVFTSPLVSAHPVTGEAVLRFAEPVADLNPVSVTVHHPNGGEEGGRFLEEIKNLLYSRDFLFEHAWKKGNVVIADNHALLHGRRAFTASAKRHLRRVNIL